VAHRNFRKLTFEESEDSHPLWTPDGKRIVYSRREGGLYSVYWKAADGMGEIEKLGSVPDLELYPHSWSKDEKAFVTHETTMTLYQADIGMMSMEGDHARKPLLNGKHNEIEPRVSPDGQWMAYQSNESGKDEVYVRPFPDVSKGQWQVSTNGGDSPLWSPDGQELFYRSGESFIAVDIETEPVFKRGKSQVLFKGTYFSDSDFFAFVHWDIHPDGKRFLMLKPSAAVSPRRINIVLNWLEELRQRVPASK
jgi:serine/threonine-protein kinase